VTTAVLQEQFDHNMMVRALVSRVNQLAAKVRAAERSGGADAARVKAIADQLLTPPIRYSQPELQEQITYLYGMTNSADQKIGHDAVVRYGVLKAQLDKLEAEAQPVLGGNR
jgi:hypothetical protein